MIDSIDEAAEVLDRSLEGSRSQHLITPEEEFVGHCSNIQVWAENDYDTLILHRNLAFPLLLKIAKYDPKAEMILAVEICYRFFNGNNKIRSYFFNKGLIDIAIPYAPLEFAICLNNGDDLKIKNLTKIYNILLKK